MIKPKNIRTCESITRLIMVVDGDARDLFCASMLLQRFEYNVCTARTAEEALELMRLARPALIITEVSLTGMSGLDLVQRLKKDPLTDSIPVIVQTSDASPETEKKCGEAGAAFLRKPIRAEELFRTVELTIGDRRKKIRIYTQLPVRVDNVALHSGENGTCLTTLSEQGMYVWTLKPSPVNARIAMQIELMGRTIILEAMVLRSHRYGEGPHGEPGMGVRFEKIAPEDTEFIRQFVDEEVTKGIKPL